MWRRKCVGFFYIRSRYWLGCNLLRGKFRLIIMNFLTLVGHQELMIKDEIFLSVLSLNSIHNSIHVHIYRMFRIALDLFGAHSLWWCAGLHEEPSIAQRSSVCFMVCSYREVTFWWEIAVLFSVEHKTI